MSQSKESNQTKMIRRSIVKFENENPNSNERFFGSFTIGKEERALKKKWIFVKKCIKNDHQLIKECGFDPDKELSNSKIVKIMIERLNYYFENKDLFIAEQFKRVKASYIEDSIDYNFKNHKNNRKELNKFQKDL